MNEIPEDILNVLGSIFIFVVSHFWLIILLLVALRFGLRVLDYRRMKDLAQRLGLEFQDPATHQKFIVQQNAGSQFQNQAIESQNIQKVASVAGIVIGAFHHWRMTGKWNGVPVSVFSESRGSGKNSARYTVIRAATESSKEYGLQIAAESFMSGLRQKFSGNSDISSGNEQFDKKMLIKAREADQAKMILSDVFLQEAILQAYEFNPSISIDDHFVSFDYRGTMKNEEKLRSALNHATRTAQALRRVTR